MVTIYLKDGQANTVSGSGDMTTPPTHLPSTMNSKPLESTPNAMKRNSEMWPPIDVEDVMSKMTMDEKISLLSGRDFWHTNSIPRLNIPSIRLSDGPNGVRGTRFFNSVPSACLPCGTALAATFDSQLLHRAGELISKEAKAKGAHVILGPTANTQRSPLGGRGFESFSEDPLLSGICSRSIIEGIQEGGLAACIKHFVCNDQEHERMSCSSEVSDRAMREIYARAFEIAIKGMPITSKDHKRKKQPLCVMTAYNRLNGTHASECPWLLDGILRKEWGYKGMVMSDWFGTYSTSEALQAGLDLEMPGPTIHRGKLVKLALGSKKLDLVVVDERVRNVLNLINNVRHAGVPENAPEGKKDNEDTTKLLREIAQSSIVLLKNDGVLPLRKDKSIAVIGPNSKVARFCGGGSASLRPYRAISPYVGIQSAIKHGTEIEYRLGAAAFKRLPLLGDNLKTPDGDQDGFVLRFYNDPPRSKGHKDDREAFDFINLTDSTVFLADYRHPKMQGPVYYVDMEAILEPEEAGDFEFGLTVHGTAKLYVEGRIVIDNETNQRQGDSFLGMGTVEEVGSMKVEKDKPYNILVQFASGPTSKLNLPGAVPGVGGGGFRVGGALKIDPKEEIRRSVDLAKRMEQVVLCIGLNSDYESEGFDRSDASLPPHTDELISAIVKANHNTVVVLQSGTPITASTDWPTKVKGIMQAWYGGNEGGNTIADVLFGDANPSGRLPLTFPLRLQDNPTYLNFGAEQGKVLYGEGVFVGYRYYEKIGRDVMWGFGRGLSYTSFHLEHLEIDSNNDEAKVSVDVKNVGKIDGANVVQVYISTRTVAVRRPVRELKGFAKTFVKAGHTEKVEIAINKGFACGYWEESKSSWCMEKGVYDVLVCDGTNDKVISGNFEVDETSRWR